MSNLIAFFVVIVVLSATPRIVAFIVCNVLAGTMTLLKLVHAMIIAIFKGFWWVIKLPYRLCRLLAKGLFDGASVYSRAYSRSYKQVIKENKAADRQRKIAKAKNKRLVSESKEVGMQQSTVMPTQKREPDPLETPTFMRQKLFQMKNGCLVRDGSNNPIRVSVATMFSTVPPQTNAKPLPQPIVRQSNPETLDLMADGYEPDEYTY